MTFSFRIFLVGAIVLIVFAIIASAQASTTLFTVSQFTWAWAALLSLFVDFLISWTVGPVVERAGPRQP